MSLYSKQKIFCNACGKEEFRELPGMGREYKVCSIDCLRDMQYREINSILGKDYIPFSKKFDENGNPISHG